MKIQYILGFFLGLLLILSCRKDVTFEVTGTVINKHTKAPISGATVTLKDGLGVSGPIISSDEITSVDTYLTGSDGKFHVKIKVESGSHAVISGGKEGYFFKLDWGGSSSSWDGVPEGKSSYLIELEGYAKFTAYLIKISSNELDQDSMKFDVLEYNDIESFNYPSLYKGKGPFNYLRDGSPKFVTGDRFLRYRIDWTNNGVWNSKIDSVYLSTSQEIFRDTIYY